MSIFQKFLKFPVQNCLKGLVGFLYLSVCWCCNVLFLETLNHQLGDFGTVWNEITIFLPNSYRLQQSLILLGHLREQFLLRVKSIKYSDFQNCWSLQRLYDGL